MRGQTNSTIKLFFIKTYKLVDFSGVKCSITTFDIENISIIYFAEIEGVL